MAESRVAPHTAAPRQNGRVDDIATRLGDILRHIWRTSTTPAPAPSPRAVLASALAALAVVCIGALWRRARLVVTIAHEGGHALVARLTGRRLAGVRLHSDTSGLTVSAGRTRGPGMVATGFAGYVAPALLGLGAAAILRAGYASAVLWILILLLAVLLPRMRGAFGWATVLAVGAALVGVSWWASAPTRVAAAYATTWFLLLGALRCVGELQAQRARGRAPSSDADQLAAITPLPGLAWVGAFALVDAACLAGAARWLLLGTGGALGELLTRPGA